jgi:hypothetical protein
MQSGCALSTGLVMCVCVRVSECEPVMQSGCALSTRLVMRLVMRLVLHESIATSNA